MFPISLFFLFFVLFLTIFTFKTLPLQNTAMHIAAKEGHSAAVVLLLERGAKMVLNKNDASFMHEAVLGGRRGTADAIIQSERSVRGRTSGRDSSPLLVSRCCFSVKVFS